jgi:hypothetical protein
LISGLAALVAACSSGESVAPACGRAVVTDSYAGGVLVDPYFYGYAGDPTFGGDPTWGDPIYYDPSYDSTTDPGSNDTTDDGSGGDSTSGDDSSGGDSTQSVRLHVTSGPLLGEACTPCAVACTFAMPGGNVPVGEVAVGERGPGDPPGTCAGAITAIELDSNGAALARCRAVDPGAAGHVPATPIVVAPASSASSGKQSLLFRPPRADLSP